MTSQQAWGPGSTRWSLVLTAVLLVWIVLVTGRGILLALQAIGAPITGVVERSFATPQMVWAAILVGGCCLAAALVTHRLRPAATLPVTFAAGAVLLLLAAIATANLGSLLVTLAIFVFAWLVGHVVLRALPTTADVPLVRAPIALGLGIGITGLLLFALSWLGLLDATAILVGAGLLALILVALDHRSLRQEARQLAAWRPGTPTWPEAAVSGIVVGVVVFALLSVFVPENTSDAILQHLPIAREIWRTGSLEPLPLMAVSQEPIGGHLLFAVAYGFGGIVAAKLVHASVGLIAIAGVAGIAWLAAGRAAAMAGAAIFACMPVVLWLVGHAFLDLFPVLFTVTAVLSLLLWQRDGRLGWVVCAGVLAGSGAATKLPTMAIMIAAMVLAVVLVGRTPGHWPGRILAAALFGFSALVTIAPWLVRGYVTGGGLSLLNPLLSRLGATPPGTDGFLLDGPVEGVESAAVRPAADHSLPGLVRLPWDLTFNTGRFGFPIIRQGEVGFAGLAMLPLLVFAPRTRMMAFLAVTAAAALFGWWLTPLQVTRHPLPALAIVAAMAGAGFAGAIAAPATPPRRALAAAAWAGLIVACLAAIVFLLPARLAALPVDVVTGRQSAADYVARQLPLTPVLAAASLEIPADSVGAYIGRHTQVPRIYSDLQLNVYENAAELGATPEEIIANLDRLDMEYLVWNRYTTNLWGLGNWRAAIVSTPFLREHTRIVAGDDNAYVFALLPAEGKTWGVDNPRNVLADPDLDTVEADGPWQTVGTVRARKGVVSMRAESALAQPVPVTAGDPYLLAATATCDAPDDRAALSLRWFDDSGQEIDLETETVFPGTDGSEQFIWRRAPEHAASVSAEVASQSCRFDRVALYDLS